MSEKKKAANAEYYARKYLYDNLPLDEAQAIAWGWEEMSDAERKALSIEERVKVRKIREDREKHKRQWGLE